jgi:hypothetical protein
MVDCLYTDVGRVEINRYASGNAPRLQGILRAVPASVPVSRRASNHMALKIGYVFPGSSMEIAAPALRRLSFRLSG